MQVRNRDLRRAAVPALLIVPSLLYFPYDTIAPGGASLKAIGASYGVQSGVLFEAPRKILSLVHSCPAHGTRRTISHQFMSAAAHWCCLDPAEPSADILPMICGLAKIMHAASVLIAPPACCTYDQSS